MPSTYLEDFFGSSWGNIVGDPLVSGVLLLAFFGIFVMLQNTRLDGKIVVLVPALVLASLFASIFIAFAVFFAGGLLYLAFTKFTNR